MNQPIDYRTTLSKYTREKLGITDQVFQIAIKAFTEAEESGRIQFIKLGNAFPESDNISAHTKQRYCVLCKVMFPLVEQAGLFDTGFGAKGSYIFNLHYHDVEKWKGYIESPNEEERLCSNELLMKKQWLFGMLSTVISKLEFEWSDKKIIKKIDATRINEIRIEVPTIEYISEFLNTDKVLFPNLYV